MDKTVSELISPSVVFFVFFVIGLYSVFGSIMKILIAICAYILVMNVLVEENFASVSAPPKAPSSAPSSVTATQHPNVPNTPIAKTGAIQNKITMLNQLKTHKDGIVCLTEDNKLAFGTDKDAMKCLKSKTFDCMHEDDEVSMRQCLRGLHDDMMKRKNHAMKN